MNLLTRIGWLVVVAALLTGCGGEVDEAPVPDAQVAQAPDDARGPEPIPALVAPEVVPEPEPVETPVIDPVPEPLIPYDGEWIGPINGLRFGMRQADDPPLVLTLADGPIRLLLFVENTTEQTIYWERFYPEPSVRRHEIVTDWEPTFDPYANLRVWCEFVRPRDPNESYLSIDTEIPVIPDHPLVEIGPGERWVGMLAIFDVRIDDHYEEPMPVDEVLPIAWYDQTWPGQNYRVRVRYQAGGFESPDGLRARVGMPGWEDVWVQFADLELYVD
ncbi:hypothetical protein OT109_00065 [Phycisphaeraceae bacterium D3-23]